MKARTCVYCGDELPLERQTKLYCSDWCQKQDQYAKNRDPYSVGATGWREGLLRKDGLPMMSVEQDILELAEEHEEDKLKKFKESTRGNPILNKLEKLQPGLFKVNFLFEEIFICPLI